MDFEIVARRVTHDRWTRVTDAMVRLPNGAIEPRVIEDHGNATAILLYNPDRRVALLIRQPRAPVLEVGAEMMLEVVAGCRDGKSDEDTARAEAFEEAGIAVRELEWVARLWPMPAVSTEQIDLFLAAYSDDDRVGSGGGAEDENECIEIHEVALSELGQMVRSGELVDGKSFTLVQALMLRRPELFA
jgi:nudix-type nucleoside diphosphatase (YffH/AdpP family)